MAGYLVARVKVTDSARFAEYLKALPAVVARFEGRHVVRGGEVATLEGPVEARRIVIIEFPTMARVREFYDSPEYQEVKKLREGAAIGELVAVNGVP